MEKTPFNLLRARCGERVTTEDGRKVRIGIWDAKSEYCLVGVVENEDGFETPETWTIDGKYYIGSACRDNDLVMATAEIEGC